jgi:hypothetical protein
MKFLISSKLNKLKEIKMNFREYLKPTTEAPYSELYFDSLTDAIKEVDRQLKKKGFVIDEESRWAEIATGPKKPGRGKTNRYNLDLLDMKGYTQKVKAHVQVYNRGSATNTYELNMYVA